MRVWAQARILFLTSLSGHDGGGRDTRYFSIPLFYTFRLRQQVWRRALCRILLVDYVCLDFVLPKFCNDIDPYQTVTCPAVALPVSQAALQASSQNTTNPTGGIRQPAKPLNVTEGPAAFFWGGLLGAVCAVWGGA